jgi:BirA family transcriptional regulator, biotin operon repressor / biotin---[acetyl-CoA-carboxylase] ligase
MTLEREVSRRFRDGMVSGGDPVPPDFADALREIQRRRWPFARHVVFFDTIGSTNDVAMKLAADAEEGTVVVANEQTAGRGRYGRTWFSPPATGLYVSIVLKPPSADAEHDRVISLLTLASGVALADAIDAVAAIRAEIKWPNDLIVGGRKLAGILAERVSSAQGNSRTAMPVILGYGINVGANAYPPELSDRATDLQSETGRLVERAALCAETLAAVSRRYQDLLAGRFDAILDAWRARAPTSQGAHVSWNTPQGIKTGVTAGIDDRGALLVQVTHGIERIVGGELTWAL